MTGRWSWSGGVFPPHRVFNKYCNTSVPITRASFSTPTTSTEGSSAKNYIPPPSSGWSSSSLVNKTWSAIYSAVTDTHIPGTLIALLFIYLSGRAPLSMHLCKRKIRVSPITIQCHCPNVCRQRSSTVVYYCRATGGKLNFFVRQINIFRQIIILLARSSGIHFITFRESQ